MPRLFTGIVIPDTTVEALARLRGGIPGARWVDAENYHLTLRFIGASDPRTATEIKEILYGVRRAGFSLSIDGLDSFGGRHPRAIFARIGTSRALTALQAEHESLMRRLGLPAESRKYAPHITLARLRGTTERDVAAYLSQTDSLAIPSFQVDDFALFSAREPRGGGPYIIEESYPLSIEAG